MKAFLDRTVNILQLFIENFVKLSQVAITGNEMTLISVIVNYHLIRVSLVPHFCSRSAGKLTETNKVWADIISVQIFIIFYMHF